MPEVILLEDQLACAERELAMRKRVYPNWVASGRMSQSKADRETLLMDCICTTLRDRIREKGREA